VFSIKFQLPSTPVKKDQTPPRLRRNNGEPVRTSAHIATNEAVPIDLNSSSEEETMYQFV